MKGVIEMKGRIYAVFAFTALTLAVSNSARADAVADWNAIAVQATITGSRPGPSGILDVAMVHAAIYDAVQAIEGQYRPYYVDIPGATGSPVAATAKAAHDVLVSLFPAQAGALGMTYEQYLIDQDVSDVDPGVAVGTAAAAVVITLRTGDGSFPVPAPPAFNGGTAIGVWRPTPPANAPMAVAWVGAVRPWTLRSSSQFRALPPPALDSPEYTRAYKEVKRLGALNGSSRTDEQTDLAHFWNLNYLVVLNALVRELAESHVSSLSDSARLFALVDLAAADALITAWDSKRHYVFWRPITAIREGENDPNPRTPGEGGWTSLVVNPPYPDYTSGANNVTGAVTSALSLFFGTDDLTFDITTTNTGPTVVDTRTFHKFSEVRDEVVEARIYQGIHFRFADAAARRQGERVALRAFSRFFRPVDE